MSYHCEFTKVYLCLNLHLLTAEDGSRAEESENFEELELQLVAAGFCIPHPAKVNHYQGLGSRGCKVHCDRQLDFIIYYALLATRV